MGLYTRHVFPALLDLALRGSAIQRRRRDLLEGAAGRILEIGAGTGLNLPCYPDSVRRLVTVDPNPGTDRRRDRRARAAGIELEPHLLRGESLPFDSASFDVAVSTWTLCSVRDVDAVLAELHRVLRPGGRLLFLEHGASPDPRVLRWQRRLTPLQRRVADGCRLDLDVRGALARSPFHAADIDADYVERTPRVGGYLYRGAATR